MKESEIRGILEGIPYQGINDSPTVKRYTDWRVFEKALDLPDAVYSENPPALLRKVKPDIELRGRVDTYIPEVNDNGLTIIRRLRRRSPKKLPETRMEALHALRWFEGAEVDIGPGAIIKKPIRVLSASGKGYVGHHLKIVVGDRAKASLILLDYGGVERGLKTFVVEGVLGAGARLDVYPITIHKWGVPSYSRRSFLLKKGSQLNVFLVTGGGVMTHERYEVQLGERASVNMLASAITKCGCALDLITNVYHTGRESRSSIRLRGGSRSNSLLVHRGVGVVYSEAEESETTIESRITVLGKEGKGYSIPMLELHTGNVRHASHSASVTMLDEDSNFYLMTRGLSKDDITDLIMYGIMTFSNALSKVFDTHTLGATVGLV